MRNIILGISAYYHDSAAALLIDGEIVAAAHEERFTRKKHDSSFPINAVRYVLQEAGLDYKDLTAVAFYDKPFLKFERLLGDLSRVFAARLGEFPIRHPRLDQRETLHEKTAEGTIGNARGWEGADLLSGTPFVSCRERLLSVAVRGSRHCYSRWRRGMGHHDHRARPGKQDHAY